MAETLQRWLAQQKRNNTKILLYNDQKVQSKFHTYELNSVIKFLVYATNSYNLLRQEWGNFPKRRPEDNIVIFPVEINRIYLII